MAPELILQPFQLLIQLSRPSVTNNAHVSPPRGPEIETPYENAPHVGVDSLMPSLTGAGHALRF
jgi:hypothetical protein